MSIMGARMPTKCDSRNTSPKTTLVSVAVSPTDDEKVKFVPSSVAGVAGSCCRQTPVFPSAVVVKVLLAAEPGLSIVIVMVACVVFETPFQTACCGARCRTMPLPSVFERNVQADACGATSRLVKTSPVADTIDGIIILLLGAGSLLHLINLGGSILQYILQVRLSTGCRKYRFPIY